MKTPLTDPHSLAKLVAGFSGKRILVYGDLVADEFVFTGEPRVSREAPVLILEYSDSEILPGGAANAAKNIAALGGIPVIVGELGDDTVGQVVLSQLKEAGADTSGIILRHDTATPRKSRILAGDRNVAVQQVVRIDRIPKNARTKDHEQAVAERTATLLRDADGVLVSDYGLGFVEPAAVTRHILENERRADFKVALDSRYRLLDYVGVDVTTPSETELEAALGLALRESAAREKAARGALADLQAESMVLTRGSQGMELLVKDADTHLIPAFGSDTVTDVTGAGDTVIATLSLALAMGADPRTAAELANAAAGIVVTKLGTATVSGSELVSALEAST